MKTLEVPKGRALKDILNLLDLCYCQTLSPNPKSEVLKPKDLDFVKAEHSMLLKKVQK